MQLASKAVNCELLTTRAKRLLFFECALVSILGAALLTLMLSRTYTFHFEQITLNYYMNGTSDFTGDVSALVRSLGTVAVFSLIFGVTTGVAIGFTCSPRSETQKSASNPNAYEEEVTRMGFVEINKTEEGTTYKLTEHGRRFLRDYRFLERTEEATV